MMHAPLFDAIASREAAERGIAQAGENKRSLLEFAKGVAVEIGKRQRKVTADDVQKELWEKHKISPAALGSAAGGLFKSSDWQDTKEVVPSVRVNAHGRLLRVWRYIGS